MLLSENNNEDLFFFFVETLETKYNAIFSLKADENDSKYFDFSLKGFHLTIHYQLGIGIELLPLSFFSEQKPTKKELEIVETLKTYLLKEKKQIESHFKNAEQKSSYSNNDIEVKTRALNEIADLKKETFDEKVVEVYFKGKNFNEIISIIGNPIQFGSMDRGQDVGSWKVRNALIEIWFYNGFCTEVTLKEMNPVNTHKHFRNRFLYFLILFLLFYLAAQVLTFDSYGGMALILIIVIGIPFILGLIYILRNNLSKNKR